MKKNIVLLFLLVTFLVTSSCLNRARLGKDPCESPEFLQSIETRSKNELLNIEKVVSRYKFNSREKSSCQKILLAKINWALGNMGLASEYFSEAARSDQELADYFYFAKAQSEFQNARLTRAKSISLALLNSKAALISNQFYLRVKKLLADIAFEQKDYLQVVKTHQELLQKGYKEDQAFLFNLAIALKKQKLHKEADEVFKKLLINFPASDQALASEKIKALGDYSFTLAEVEKRLDQLIKNLAFERAVKDAGYFAAKKQFNSEERALIESKAIKSLVLNNQFEKGITRAKKRLLSRNHHSLALQDYAWSLGKVDRSIEASDYYLRYAKSAEKPSERAKGCFFAGFSLYESNLYSMAKFTWQNCQQEMTDSLFEEKYLWLKALASMLETNYSDALESLRLVAQKFKKSEHQDKYKYFLAYNMKHLGQKSQGDEILRNLARSSKPGYYNLLARKGLGLEAPKGKFLSENAFSNLAIKTKNKDVAKAIRLYNLGFIEDASDIVQNSSIAQVKKLALLQHFGKFHQVWKRSYLLAPAPKIKGRSLNVKPTVRASYPVAHRNIIRKSAKQYGINQSLLYAIIRAESGFSPKAQSYRGALGLMQMMPFVAKDLAMKLGLESFETKQLAEPEVAIKLGSVLFASLQKQFGKPFLAIAAYNAGPHQVQKWVDQFGELPPELLIERMPFKQTRKYVKEVLSNESLYHALDGGPLRLML